MTEKRIRLRCWLSGSLLLGLLLAGGCTGGPKGNVSGKVYYKDKLVSGGSVSFFAEDGKPYPSDISEDGDYNVTKCPAGAVTIAVTGPPPPFEMPKGPGGKAIQIGPPKDTKDGPPKDAITGPKSIPKEKYVKVPEKFNDKATSGLKHTVPAGDSKFDIKMTD